AAAWGRGGRAGPGVPAGRGGGWLLLGLWGLAWGGMAGARWGRHLPRRRGGWERNGGGDGGRLKWMTPKNHEARTVPLPRDLVDELAAGAEGLAAADLLFPSPCGDGNSNRNAGRQGWDRTGVAAGARGGLTPHERSAERRV